MRSIDADALMVVMQDSKYAVPCNDFQRGVNACADILITEIKHFPTLDDFVPREEVERIKREIFECLEPSFAIGEFTGSAVFFAIRAEDYNRCKNKYTEDSPDGKRTDR